MLKSVQITSECMPSEAFSRQTFLLTDSLQLMLGCCVWFCSVASYYTGYSSGVALCFYQFLIIVSD